MSTQQLRALAHPVRLQMLSLLTGAEMSAAEVARELGLTHANASYHLRFLLGAGELVVSGERRIRGGVARLYRHPWRPGATTPATGWLGEPDAELYLRAATEELLRRFRQRADPPKAVLTDAELWVTPEAYQRAFDLLLEASELLHDTAVPPRTDGSVPVNVTVAAFVLAAQTEDTA